MRSAQAGGSMQVCVSNEGAVEQQYECTLDGVGRNADSCAVRVLARVPGGCGGAMRPRLPSPLGRFRSHALKTGSRRTSSLLDRPVRVCTPRPELGGTRPR